jgi:hypothetical protein
MILINQQEEGVEKYENVFKIGNMGAVSMVELKVIQGMIQIDCPINSSIQNKLKIANEIKWIE